ncbi:MAG: DUF1501 domain-containing protein [Akkermansiaceae bacterium]
MSKTLRNLSRRQFLKAGTCGTMTIGPLVNTISQLSLMRAATTSAIGAEVYDSTDYKALVCVFLSGGADANNIIIPRAAHDFGEIYANDRGAVGIANGVDSNYNNSETDDTVEITVDEDDTKFGLHPSLVNLAAMFNNKEAAFITNVGTLAEPTTKLTYSTSSLPKQLFSHSDQITEWMSSIADQPYKSGWGARIADLYNDTWNEFTQTSMMITASGSNKFLGGGNLGQYSVSSAGAISLAGFGTDYANAADTSSATGIRFEAMERIMQYSHAHIIEEGYAEVLRSARASEQFIKEAMSSEDDLAIDFDSIWSDYNATEDIGDQLKSVARLIAGRSSLGNNRQIFFVNMGSFDHHKGMNATLAEMLTSLDNALGAFNQAMQELAVADNDFSYDSVTTFQASDFNRTWTANKSAVGTAGTDHAWGTHTFVFGGAIEGGAFYGTFPELGVGSADDVPSGSRGRWIPTTSVDQYAAVLANWLGVDYDSSEMTAIFPNLDRFQDPRDSSSNMNFFKSV